MNFMKKIFLLSILICFASNLYVWAYSDNEIELTCSISHDGVNRYKFPLFIDDDAQRLFRAKHIEFTGKKEVFNKQLIKITDSGIGASILSIVVDRTKGTMSMVVDTYSPEVGKLYWEGTCSKL